MIAVRILRHAWGACLVLGVFGFAPSAARADEAPASPGAAASARVVGAEVCRACHQAEYDEWHGSKHAGAFSTGFGAHWEETGKNASCLACHTTGFDPAQQAFQLQGVSCEACHGAFQSGHPQSAKMLLPTDSTACMACHKKTYREWQLSGHAKQNIRCFDCHEVHKQGLRQSQVESQCGACHPQRMEDFAHATHHFQGLTCATCHMPPAQTSNMFQGAGAPAHNWFVSVETCAACHEEMVHKSHTIPSLMSTVEQLSEQADVQHAVDLESKLRQSELALDVQRGRTLKAAIMAFLAGLILGALILLAMRRNP